jgi:hypothetical protein
MKYLYLLYLLYHYGYIYSYVSNGIYYFRLGKKLLDKNMYKDEEWIIV